MSSSDLDEKFAPYLTVTEVIVGPIGSLSLAFVGYGLYSVIFGLCIHSLWNCRDRPNRKLFLSWIISLFLMNTLFIIFDTWLIIRQTIIEYVAAKSHSYDNLISYLNGDALSTFHTAMLAMLGFLIPATADSILIHRCYVVWGNSWKIAIPLLILFFISSGWSMADNIIFSYAYSNTGNPTLLNLLNLDSKIDAWNGLVTSIVNIIITTLTAMRIWWITREASKLMGKPIKRRYRRVITVLLESGALFPAALITNTIVIILANYNVNGLQPIDLSSLISQAAGIAPTLIILRLSRGEAVESVDQVVSSLHFAENLNNSAAQQNNTGGHRVQTVDLEQVFAHEEPKDLTS